MLQGWNLKNKSRIFGSKKLFKKLKVLIKKLNKYFFVLNDVKWEIFNMCVGNKLWVESRTFCNDLIKLPRKLLQLQLNFFDDFSRFSLTLSRAYFPHFVDVKNYAMRKREEKNRKWVQKWITLTVDSITHKHHQTMLNIKISSVPKKKNPKNLSC